MKTQSETLPLQDVRTLDLAILPKGQSHRWHEALMDFGATVCTKRNPKCVSCPLRPLCPSSKHLIKSVASTAPSREAKYFGSPRRIWRGRSLKAISQLEPVTVTQLARHFAITDDGFVEFLSDVVSRLEHEGFVRKKHRKLWLAD